MVLTKVLFGFGFEVDSELEITGIQADSRKIKRGNIFVAYKGVEVDGHDFIDQAIEKGAVAIVGEAAGLRFSVPYFRVDNGRLAWARMISNWYGNPEKLMKFIGVTGTDGKTTTCNLIYHFLKADGKKVGMVSTVFALVDGEMMETGLHTSSPDPDDLWKILAIMASKRCEYVVLETTSHGLDQDRFGNIEFEVGVLTNLASDHLEYHKTIDEYAKAKAKLMNKSRISVINKQVEKLSLFVRSALDRVVYYDRKSEVRKEKYIDTGEKVVQSFEVMIYGDWYELKSDLLGDYNQENILAAMRTALSLGVDIRVIRESLVVLPQLPGRFEMIKNKRGMKVVVDFAHTEQGMRGVLTMIREKLMQEGEQMVVCFGCNGERDRSKRAPMGRVACGLADRVVVTSEDPRNEPVEQIFKDIYKGCLMGGGELGKNVYREDDRKKALQISIRKLAKKGDWVVFLGKGHEKSMNIGGVEKPWDEKGEVEKILNR